MDKALQYLSIARKGGMAELGEEPVGAIARAGKAYLILVAADASDHTWRRAKSFAAGTDQQCVRLKSTKEEMDQPCHRRRDGCPAGADPADGAWRTGEKPGSSGSAFRQGRKGKEASGRSESPCKKCAKREKEAVVLSSKQSAEAHIPCVPLSACHILEVRFIV